MTKFKMMTSDHTLEVEIEALDYGEGPPGEYCTRFTMHGHFIWSRYSPSEFTIARGLTAQDRWAQDCLVLAQHGLDPDSFSDIT